MNSQSPPDRVWLSHVLQLVKRFLFPDFSNRITMLVLIAGIGLVAIPQELQLALANWALRLVNTSGWLGELPSIEFQPDPMGYVLIVLALAHNLANRYLTYRLASLEREIAIDRRKSDQALFAKLLELLPSTGYTLELLREHDFSGSFHRAAVSPLHEFVSTWDNAEHEFLNKDVELAKQRLLSTSNGLALKIAQYAAPKGGDMFTVIPLSVDSDGPWPDYLRQEIRELNETANVVYQAHQEFVRVARRNL